MSCMKVQDNNEGTIIFKSKPSTASGIDFRNTITESDSLNYFTYPYLYMGGGVAIGEMGSQFFIN